MKKIQILGTDCPKCRLLAEIVERAARELGLRYELQKVTDLSEILRFGVMVPPALVVDGSVRVSGRVPSLEETKKLLSD